MRLKSILFATMLLLCGLSFTACDNSDPDEQKPSPIETPSYTMDAAKYEITDASSAYKAVELTEAGRYIIVMKGASPSNTDSDDLYITGHFSKNNNVYVLQELGELTITKAGNSYSLLLNVNGRQVQLPATKVTPIPSGQATDYLCRTWRFIKMHIVVKYDGQTVFDGTSSSSAELSNALRKAIDRFEKSDKLKNTKEVQLGLAEEEFPKTITFTHAGTYFIAYKDPKENILNYWNWVNVEEKLIGFSEEKVDLSSKSAITADFTNNQLILSETEKERNETIITTVTLNQDK